MNIGQDFQKFTKNISEQDMIDYTKKIVKSSQTPMILEEREMRAYTMSVFDRLMMDRIIWIAGPVESRMSAIVEAQLMFLDSIEKKDITMYLSTPGGSVNAGLGIVSAMNMIKSDVSTICMEMCASMGSVLLSSGTKGKRHITLFGEVMTHMVSHGIEGNVQDTRISHLQAEKYNYILFKLLAKNCGKTFEELYELSRRDKWFNADDAVNFGLVDKVIPVPNIPTITELLEGFDYYYSKEILLK